MSLVQSIFGDVEVKKTKTKAKAKAKKEPDLAGLFDKFPAEQQPQPNSSLFDKKPSKKDTKSDSSSSSSSSGSNSDDSSSDDDSVKDKQDKSKSTKKRKASEEDLKDDQKSTTESKGEPKAKPQTLAEKEDEEKRTVFVGNLPLSTTRKSLAKLFSEVGKVHSTRLRSVAVVGVKLPQAHAGNQNLVKKVCTNTQQLDVDAKSSLQGYVVFTDAESVSKAIAQLNNRPLQDENPKATRAIRRIRVDTATPTMDPKRSVFVGNLPYSADEASLQDHFVQGCQLADITDVEGVRLVRDKETFQCKGIGYVLFKDASMVATALQRMHDSVYMKRPLRVKVCGNSNKNKGRHNRGGQQDSSPADKKRSNNNAAVDPATATSRKKPRLQEEPVNNKPTAPGAMRRVALKEKKKTKRMRGEKKKALSGGPKPGVSKRAAADAKTEKRVKKIKQRISKGMGKTRKA